eukprot:2303622-Rhodomonas_salina.1
MLERRREEGKAGAREGAGGSGSGRGEEGEGKGRGRRAGREGSEEGRCETVDSSAQARSTCGAAQKKGEEQEEGRKE